MSDEDEIDIEAEKTRRQRRLRHKKGDEAGTVEQRKQRLAPYHKSDRKFEWRLLSVKEEEEEDE